MTQISRRGILKAAVGSAALAAASVSGAKTVPADIAWDESVDVLIVGSGFAGLMAAYEAKKAGSSVLVIEKMPTPGGNSVINGGIMGVPGNDFQKADGIEDSPEQMIADTMKAGHNINHIEKVRAMAEGALPAYRMLIDELGVEFKMNRHEGGHSVPRSALTKEGSGAGIVNKELEALEKQGVKPRLRTIMDRILQNDKGEVIGLEVREGYRFGREDSGKKKMIRANKAVVLAYGGFGADVEYRRMFDPNLNEKFDTTNQPGSTAEGWREAASIGAQMIQQDWIQCLPYTSPDEKGFGIAWNWTGSTSSQGFWMDAATGERFVNELADRKIRCDAIFERLNQGHECLAVGDSGTAEGFAITRPGMLQRLLKAKVAYEYATLEDLAKAYNTPLDALKKTVADVNESIRTKVDPMGRRVFEGLKPMGNGPWYVTRILPKVHHCMGGILTTARAEVIDVRGKVIPRLFAAGEATGGVHGAVRLGSNATVDCIVNGGIAGREAAALKAW